MCYFIKSLAWNASRLPFLAHNGYICSETQHKIIAFMEKFNFLSIAVLGCMMLPRILTTNNLSVTLPSQMQLRIFYISLRLRVCRWILWWRRFINSRLLSLSYLQPGKGNATTSRHRNIFTPFPNISFRFPKRSVSARETDRFASWNDRFRT